MRRYARFLMVAASAVWLAASSAAQTVNIFTRFSDFQTNAANVSQVEVTPVPTNGTFQGALLSQYFPTFTRGNTPSLTNGYFTLSNAIQGVVYKMTFTARGGDQTYYINADTNAASGSTIGAWTNVVSPTNLTANGLFGYSIAQANTKFLYRAGDTGSNETFTGKLKLPPGTGQVGYVWTMTNADGSGEFQVATGGGSGSGDVVGPSTSFINELPFFDQTTGKHLGHSGVGYTNIFLNTTAAASSNSVQGQFAASNTVYRAAFDVNGAATAATNGYPWGALYDALNTALNATNNIGIASGFSAFVNTNRFDTNGAADNALQTALNAALAATNNIGIPSGLSAFVSTNRFDYAGAAHDATNGYPWGSLYDPAGAASGFVVLIPSNSTTAQIQAMFNNLTNGGAVSIQPGDYTITASLRITNNVSIQGNGAAFHFLPGLTNAMMTVTNGTSLLVDNLKFDGGTYLPFNTVTYASNHTGFLSPYYNTYWSNRTGLYVDAIKGARVQNCTFYGWSGAGCLAFERGGTDNAQTLPKFEFINSICYTNFMGVFAACANTDIPGYNNSASSLWIAGAAAEYSVLYGNNCYQNQMGMVVSAGNCLAQVNTLNANYIGLAAFAGINCQHGHYANNTLNHNHDAIYFEFDNGEGAGLFEDNQMLANDAIVFNFSTGITFRHNHFGAAALSFTNGSWGDFIDNTYIYSAVWGDTNAVVAIVTNFSPGILISGNTDSGGTNNDGTMTSIVHHSLNHAFPGAFASSPDGSNASWTLNGNNWTNLSPAIATNNAGAADGTVLSKTGNNLKLIAASGSGTVTSVNVAEQGYSSDGPVTTSGTATLTQNADKNHLGFSETNINKLAATNSAMIGGPFIDPTNVLQVNTLGGAKALQVGTNAVTYVNTLGIDQWQTTTNPANHSLVISNTVFGGNLTLTTNGVLAINGVPFLSANGLGANQIPYTDSSTNLVGSTNNVEFEAVLAPSSNATNYTIDFNGPRKLEIWTANTNANITFLNVGTNHSVDLYVNALTSTVPCNITYPPHIRLNHFASLSVSNTTATFHHIDFFNGTDPTNAVVTGGDYYQIQ